MRPAPSVLPWPRTTSYAAGRSPGDRLQRLKPAPGDELRRDSVAAVPDPADQPAGDLPMPRSTPQSEPHDWVTRAADDAIAHHEKSGASGPVTCSSGASPSGRVHL